MNNQYRASGAQEDHEADYDAQYSRAKKRAMYLLGSRAHAREELRQKLAVHYHPAVCENVVALMEDYGYLDDYQYAEKYVSARLKKGYGLYRIKRELLDKGIHKEIIQDVLQVDKSAVQEELQALLQKKYRDKLSDAKDRQRTIQALLRRGHGMQDILSAIKQVQDIDAFDEEMEDDLGAWE